MNPAENDQPISQEEWDLIAGDVLGDLSEEEKQSYDELGLERHRESHDELAKTAAAIHLVFETANMESMPDQLRERILSDAVGHLKPTAVRTREPHASVVSARTDERESGPKVTTATSHTAAIGKREITAWLAFAASLAFAIVVWNRNAPTETPALSLADARNGLIQTANDVTQVSWAEGTTPFENAVEGDVVWSNARQSGYMRFVGMPVNDPLVEQYQLWIIDPERDEEPIDGGVFDVTSDGEAIVAINAKLAVLDPAAFAITIEKPGGVVVSTQERLPLIASIQ